MAELVRKIWLRLSGPNHPARDCRGTSTIEFALVAPALALLTLGMINSAMGFADKLKLEQAAQRTIEKALTAGKVGGNYSYLIAEAALAAGTLPSAVTLEEWLECDNVKQDPTVITCPSAQQIGRYVSISIVKDYTPLIKVSAIGYGSTIQLTGAAAVRVQ